MSDKYEELEKLQSLKEREIISEEEFQREKEKILNAPEKKNVEFNFNGIVNTLKNKRVIFIIIAVILIIIAIVCDSFHDTYYKQGVKVSNRHSSILDKRLDMEKSNYYSENEYKELCEKEDELSEEYTENFDQATTAHVGFNVCIYLSLFMCFLHAVCTLKGNNLNKKEFLKKLIVRMVIPVLIVIILFLLFY